MGQIVSNMQKQIQDMMKMMLAKMVQNMIYAQISPNLKAKK